MNKVKCKRTAWRCDFPSSRGGIAKCDLIAEALVKAGREVGFKVPVVVRLEGTNVDKARQILAAAKSELPTLIPATDLTDAAKKVTAAVA